MSIESASGYHKNGCSVKFSKVYLQAASSLLEKWDFDDCIPTSQSSASTEPSVEAEEDEELTPSLDEKLNCENYGSMPYDNVDQQSLQETAPELPEVPISNKMTAMPDIIHKDVAVPLTQRILFWRSEMFASLSYDSSSDEDNSSVTAKQDSTLARKRCANMLEPNSAKIQNIDSNTDNVSIAIEPGLTEEEIYIDKMLKIFQSSFRKQELREKCTQINNVDCLDTSTSSEYSSSSMNRGRISKSSSLSSSTTSSSHSWRNETRNSSDISWNSRESLISSNISVSIRTCTSSSSSCSNSSCSSRSCSSSSWSQAS